MANENNITLILVKSPCELNEKDEAKYNFVEAYAKKNNILFINYNKDKAIKLVEGDFYDSGHLSLSGAVKVSKDFLKYLK